jgi:hypothetical protein
LEYAEVEQLLRERQAGPLAGFRSRQGRTFSATLKLADAFEVKFDFPNDRQSGNNDESAEEAPDFSQQEPLGACPKCQARVFETEKVYLCERAAGLNKQCDFRSGKVILQQPVDRAQMTKLLAEGKSSLLDKFISRRGRPFKAYLVVEKEGKVGFEFEKRESGARARKPKEPEAPLDFSGQEPLGVCPVCGGKVFESEKHYLCERAQQPTRPCKFKMGKTILQRPIRREEVVELLTQQRSGLLEKFISSKTGKSFSAFLTVGEKGKIEFEFPPREGTS